MAPDPLSAGRERLRRLEQLRAEGILTDEEYAAKRAAVVDDVTVPPSAPDHPANATSALDTEQKFCPSCGVARERLADRYCRTCGHLWASIAPSASIVDAPPSVISRTPTPTKSAMRGEIKRPTRHGWLWKAVVAYARWGSARSKLWQRALVLGAPIVLVLLIVRSLISPAPSSSGSTQAGTAAGSHLSATATSASLSPEDFLARLAQDGIACNPFTPGTAPVGRQAKCTVTSGDGTSYPVSVFTFDRSADFKSWKQTMDDIGCHLQMASFGFGTYELNWVQVGDSNWVIDPEFRESDAQANKAVADQLAATLGGDVRTSGC